MTMETLKDLLAHSMPTFDPVLGSLWDQQDVDADCLAMKPSNLQNNQDQVQNHSQAVTSPSHGLDQLPQLQPDSPQLEHLLHDWGALDDLIYRNHIEERPENLEDEHAMKLDNGTIHTPTFQIPQDRNDPDSFSVASSSDELFSSFSPSYLPELQTFKFVSIASSEPPRRSSQSSLTRSGSTSSLHSERGRTRTKDKYNVQRPLQRDRSAFQELVFDSHPTRSPSRASTSSGRRGPLDVETIATMNAVKVVGACWRCKVMRKSCNADTPCDSCQKIPRSSLWQAVGCKRGLLSKDMPRIMLCSRTENQLQNVQDIPDGTTNSARVDNEWVQANTYREELICKRDRDIANSTQSAESWSEKVNALLGNLSGNGQDDIGGRHADFENRRSLDALKPLEETILAVVWELCNSKSCEALLEPWVNSKIGPLESFIFLLSSAAAYEVNSNDRVDSLITQSLICLRCCIEILSFQTSGYFKKLSHKACVSSACKIECVRSLTHSLEVMFEKISVGIMKKENFRNERWWMSTFYSLCIQSVVRRALMVLERQPTDAGHDSFDASDHFGMAVQLFIAISGNYDPLFQDLSTEPLSSVSEFSRIEEITAAQSVVNQHMWRELGLTCSGDYLRRLFDVEALSQEVSSMETEKVLGAAHVIIYPEPYLPDNLDIESYRQFHADWDLARCNYTKEVVSIGLQHGWDSDIYASTEDEWASVDALWKKHGKIALDYILEIFKTAGKLDLHDIETDRDIGLSNLLESNDKQGQEKHLSAIYSSITQVSEPLDVTGCDSGAGSQEQVPRFAGDLYWPRWIRGQENSTQEGWCGMCNPGRWLPLDGSFQDDKDFKHGVSAATGKPFNKPKEVRRMKIDPKIWWGLCGTCGDWVELLGSKEGETAWFVHSFGVIKYETGFQVVLALITVAVLSMTPT